MKVVMASVNPFQFFSSGKLTKKLAEHKISKDFLHFSIIQRMKLVKRIHHQKMEKMKRKLYLIRGIFTKTVLQEYCLFIILQFSMLCHYIFWATSMIMMLHSEIGVFWLEPFCLCFSNKQFCLLQKLILDQMDQHGLFQPSFSFIGSTQGQ